MTKRYKNSFRSVVLNYIQNMDEDVILRSDVNALGEPRQVSRALKALVEDGQLIKLGYGVYAKLSFSRLTGQRYLRYGLLITSRLALTRLGLRWELSRAEQAYNKGISQQIPVNPITKISGRVRRTFVYNGREFRYESKY